MIDLGGSGHLFASSHILIVDIKIAQSSTAVAGVIVVRQIVGQQIAYLMTIAAQWDFMTEAIKKISAAEVIKVEIGSVLHDALLLSDGLFQQERVILEGWLMIIQITTLPWLSVNIAWLAYGHCLYHHERQNPIQTNHHTNIINSVAL